jgi:hypothetical protein
MLQLELKVNLPYLQLLDLRHRAKVQSLPHQELLQLVLALQQPVQVWANYSVKLVQLRSALLVLLQQPALALTQFALVQLRSALLVLLQQPALALTQFALVQQLVLLQQPESHLHFVQI